MFSTGFAIFLAMGLLLIKLRRRWMLRALNYDLALDLIVSAIVLTIHWGTFSGVMAATFAGLLTSVATSGAKRLFGYIADGVYYPGFIRLNVDA